VHLNQQKKKIFNLLHDKREIEIEIEREREREREREIRDHKVFHVSVVSESGCLVRTKYKVTFLPTLSTSF
jgi:hypothetical protein